MRFTVQREAILKPLQQIIGVVERRQTLPVLSNILLSAKSKENLSLTTTDLEVELTARVDTTTNDTGDSTLPARKFMDICRALPEEASLEISIEEDRAIIRSGKSRFSLTALAAAEFPVLNDIQATHELKLPQTTLKTLIERTYFAMAQQDVRYYLNGLMIELSKGTLRAVATDGHRLALSEIDADITLDDVPQQIIVPRKGVHELLRTLEDTETLVHLQIGGNHIRVLLPEIQFTSKLIDGRFPDYQKVLPKGGDKVVTVDREALRQALTRTSILSNEKYRGIRLHIESGLLQLRAHNPEHEEAEEDVQVEYQGDPLDIGFNASYLMDALAAIPSPTVRATFTDMNSSCLIQGTQAERSQYVVMPMRL